MNLNPDDATVEEVALEEQFPPDHRVPFDMGLGDTEPAEDLFYGERMIACRFSVTNTEEEAHAKARAFLGEGYAITRAFRTARYWVFYVEA